jgi:hypothetical protein
MDYQVFISKTFRADMQYGHGHDSMNMQHGYTALTWPCGTDIVHELAARTYSMDIKHGEQCGHAVWTYSVNLLPGHAAGTCSLEMHHRYAARTCSVDMHEAGT